jgi:FixJ family two-component response regulator
MPAAELDLIRRLLADETTDDLARELALTSRAVRYRRAQITDRLRDLALAA